MWAEMAYNCARVHVGTYVGGGTNEDEQWVECNYEVATGTVVIKRLQPIRIQGTNSEGTIFTLSTFVLYPKSETALVAIKRGKRTFHVRLVKSHNSRKTMFKLRL
jgi:hypothetical protein